MQLIQIFSLLPYLPLYNARPCIIRTPTFHRKILEKALHPCIIRTITFGKYFMTYLHKNGRGRLNTAPIFTIQNSTKSWDMDESTGVLIFNVQWKEIWLKYQRKYIYLQRPLLTAKTFKTYLHKIVSKMFISGSIFKIQNYSESRKKGASPAVMIFNDNWTQN